ncbi:hypothetical protein BDV28DRAFT_93023 [Aspergillus coremiiformis]|uniref:Uncharacterized protein n=1 Tax=Aspergillus coremiiformis TaxID=138285 RepID=A0A5N6YU29_9EURO|nr:hypothetical protein BDV28DRAFT_93023 [Aspergillus coremiiformis]
MARVFRRPASAFTRRAPSRAAQRTARKHKVIMESITQEKKKLRSVVCHYIVWLPRDNLDNPGRYRLKQRHPLVIPSFPQVILSSPLHARNYAEKMV